MFTSEQIEEIHSKLRKYTKKDSELEMAAPISDTDMVALVQLSGNIKKNTKISPTDLVAGTQAYRDLTDRMSSVEAEMSQFKKDWAQTKQELEQFKVDLRKEWAEEQDSLQTFQDNLTLQVNEAIAEIKVVEESVKVLKQEVENSMQSVLNVIKQANEVLYHLDHLVLSETVRHMEWVPEEPVDPKEDTLYIVKNCN